MRTRPEALQEVAPGATLRVAHLSDGCFTLGPGPRAVIWVQGCDRECPGCIAPELQPREGGREVAVESLARWLSELPVRGVTVSGGEPMAQAQALEQLVRQVRTARPGLDWICYTGWAIEDLVERGLRAQRWLCEEGLDVLIDGPFVEGRPEALLRGSDNQRLIGLTLAGRALLAEGRGNPNGVQAVLREGRLFWMGIPPRGFRDGLPAALELVGVHLEEEN